MIRLAAALLAVLWAGAAVAQDQMAIARAYLERLEPLPDAFTTGRFEPTPGIVLETGHLPARGARRGTVVFVPGYTAPLELYGREIRVLAEAGWDVAAIVMRGQGRSVRLTERHDLGHVVDYANLVDDLSAFVARQDGPVVLLGLSMGGHVALRAVAEGRVPDVAAVATLVPMVDVAIPFPARGASRALARVLATNGAATRYLPGTTPWARRVPLGELLRRDKGTICTPDPELAHLRRALMEVHPELRIEVPSPGWVDATFRSIARLDAVADRIDRPVLMVTAARDRVVSTPAATRLCARMDDCRERRLPDAPHCAVEGDAARSNAAMSAILPFLAQAAQ